jgi:hypothetical protein
VVWLLCFPSRDREGAEVVDVRRLILARKKIDNLTGDEFEICIWFEEKWVLGV